MSISVFNGVNRWLSNFADVKILQSGRVFDSVEAAFQAAKCKDPMDKKRFERLNPIQAKKLGRRIMLRHDWNEKRDFVMLDLCRQKFQKEPFKQLLRDTGDEQLTEGNHWGDRYWGVCNGEGKNKLGKILMRIREEIS